MKSTDVLTINVKLTILKPAAEVFKAILTPVPFFLERASGPMTAGQSVQWKFAEMPEEFPVTVNKVEPDRMVRFEWDAGMGYNTVDIELEKRDGGTTISITEAGFPANEEGRTASYQNHYGWTHYACALKGYLEYGVNLRKGAFLHHKFE